MFPNKNGVILMLKNFKSGIAILIYITLSICKTVLNLNFAYSVLLYQIRICEFLGENFFFNFKVNVTIRSVREESI